MKQSAKLSQEKKKDLTDLLLSGITVKEAATLTETTIGRANAIRTKLVNAGILNRTRKLRVKRNNVVLSKSAVQLFDTIAPAADTEATSNTSKTVVKSKKTTQTPDLTNVVGQTFVFRINNMDVQVSDARKVHVQRGMIEIKY